MSARPKESLEQEVQRLREQLAESQQTIRALVAGEVDSVIRRDETGPVLLRAAQQALQQSEKLFRAIFDGAMDSMLITDDDGHYVDANPAAAEVLGLAREEVVGRTVADIAEPGLDFESTWNAFLSEGHARGEFVAVRPDGERRTLDYAATANVLPGRHLSVMRDVTDKRTHERQLRQAERRLATVVNSTPLVLYAMDVEGRFTLAEGRGLRRLGIEPDELMGASAFELFADRLLRLEDGTTIAAGDGLRRVLAGETIHAVAEPGDDVFFETHYQPTWDSEGRVVGIHGIAFDVTDRARAERELAMRDEQLRQAQKMESIGRLAGGIAHDFNNVLSAIQGFGEFLRDDLPEGDTRREDAEEILEAAQRAARLTQQLLAFGRKQVLSPEVFELNGLVSGVQRMLGRVLGEDVVLHTKLGEDTGHVEADPGQLEQVLVNLAINARDAMASGGTLTIATESRYAPPERVDAGLPAGRYAVLSVRDTGDGMDETTARQIFEPFFTTKERGKGTGLGLSTTYGIVKQSGGDIVVHSTPGHGAVFDVYLPRASRRDTERPAAPTKSSMPAAAHETILVVEDEELVRKLVRQILERRGYRCVAAADAVEAERLFDEHGESIELVLTDVVMPGDSGPELADRLWAKRPVPVLFMSGYADEPLQRALERAQVVQKPFGSRTLLDAVRGVLDET